VEKRLDALQRVKLDGFTPVIAELSEEIHFLSGRRDYIENSAESPRQEGFKASLDTRPTCRMSRLPHNIHSASGYTHRSSVLVRKPLKKSPARRDEPGGVFLRLRTLGQAYLSTF
jgi:hypothetical protein